MRNFAVSALCVALAGCVKYHPRPLDPPRIEQQFRARTLNDPGLRAFVAASEWPPAKLELRHLVAIAIYWNADLEVARAQARTAEAAIVSANAHPNPFLSAGGGWTNSPESSKLFSFDPSLLIETKGKRRLRVLAAEKRAEAARVQVAAAAWQVRSKVRTAWLDHVFAVRAMELLREEAGARRDGVRLMEARLRAGEASRPEADILRSELIPVEVAAQAAGTAVAETRAALAAAVGMPALPDVDVAIDPPPVSPALERIQDAGLLNRADLRRGLLDYAAAELDLQLEVARQYPDVQLNPGYGFDEGHHKISFAPSLPLPLFNRNRGPIAEAEARRAEAEARFVAAQAQAIGDMQAALARYAGALRELRETGERLVPLQKAREKFIRTALAAGEEDRLALAGARVQTALAARAQLEALHRAHAALGTLEDAVQRPLTSDAPMPGPERKR